MEKGAGFMKRLGMALFVCLVFIAVSCHAQGKGDDMVVESGKKISFEYTLNVDGQVADSSQGRGPLEYVHGEGKIIPGVSKGLEGMHVGEEKKFTIPPEEGYGEIDEKAFKEVPRSSLPGDIELQVGMPLQTRTADGGVWVVKIVEIKEDTVVLDFNHPLAGKILTFDVKVVSIQ